MYTLEDIRVNIHPVPQRVCALDKAPLVLTPDSKFCLTAPAAEKGPVKTAVERLCAFFAKSWGENCFCDDGIKVVLALDAAPAEVKNPEEGYRIAVESAGITITGFGEKGLFYGVVSFLQMCRSAEMQVPALEVLDWPDNVIRSYKEECRYGSNVMEKQGWLEMIDDLADKKFNLLSVGLYGCWVVQYDQRVAEYLYLPIKGYPQLKTPQTVKYYSPTEDRWYNYETLPPIFRDDFFGEIVAYAKDRAIDVVPGVNSFGHNTLFPRLLPEVAPKDENGDPVPLGFCTSSPETYKLLFSIYDQIIDEYLIPNNIDSFAILLDEVMPMFGARADKITEKISPWCQCEHCRGKDKADVYIEHAIKLISYLKSKGMKTIYMANDMLVGHSSQLGNLSEKMRKAVHKAGLEDVLLLGWWDYEDIKEDIHFKQVDDSLGIRSMVTAWNGYYSWCLLSHPMRNIQYMLEMGKNSTTCEGANLYAMWDRSFDRIHDLFADLVWNYAGAGSLDDARNRYVARHFAPIGDEAARGLKLMEQITEVSKVKKDPAKPLEAVVSNYHLLRNSMTYYGKTYYVPGEPYPRHHPGSSLEKLLKFRVANERAMRAMVPMSKEAMAIFEKAAKTPGCNREMAKLLAYECENYLCMAENWLALLKIYDITQCGEQKGIAPIARSRETATLEMMRHCEQVKDIWTRQGALMRNHSVMLTVLTDIANYIESTETPCLNLMDITPIISEEAKMLR